ncbi:isopentenyl-diphosphate Delta-isomerase [Dactylosporangium aurantiacum]|uniref:Isopentenyl-diphosphate Delta-isomerase n=1 Tax=Dactylosporangium aurantiacum TaxID=35754 RepID=A0A9Q9MP80_9ACTN|nr:isopentenyl-diphosphate Delta-isomerase [Dactylosporangium aurantiacum]MDG6109085.1 isopentenyl-diphosphate Delta-isomerase [Dactylosporangium aurantiacum]UWZ60221.1 isopentenyl-diphosphate Delta-isomerase [Dactylosporangium aurantiacum]
MSSREQQLVELVDTVGGAVGAATVDEAHRAPGQLHRAFSVMLVDDDGRVLLQQRAAVKTRFALRWANACCGHPAPGETVTDAARRRLAEELGVTTVPLREVGVYVYQAADPATGRVEFEYDHVLVGSFTGAFAVDPAEVAAVEWVAADGLAARLSQTPDRYAPWLAGVVAAWQGSSA